MMWLCPRKNSRKALRTSAALMYEGLFKGPSILFGLGARGRADMIRRKATVLQKTCLPCALCPTGWRQPEPRSTHLEGQRGPVWPRGESGLDQVGRDSSPPQLRCDAQRALATARVVGNVVLRAAAVVEDMLAGELRHDARRRNLVETLLDEPVAQLPAAEVAAREQPKSRRPPR